MRASLGKKTFTETNACYKVVCRLVLYMHRCICQLVNCIIISAVFCSLAQKHEYIQNLRKEEQCWICKDMQVLCPGKG